MCEIICCHLSRTVYINIKFFFLGVVIIILHTWVEKCLPSKKDHQIFHAKPFFSTYIHLIPIVKKMESFLTSNYLAFQGDSLRTNIQLDFGDGTAVSYSNLSWTEEGIKHVYKAAGIVRVTALAENMLGYDTTTLYLHVTCKWRYISVSSMTFSLFEGLANYSEVIWSILLSILCKSKCTIVKLLDTGKIQCNILKTRW